MKIIAFKRSMDHKKHPLFIEEYFTLDKSVQNIDGYETMLEDHFNKELALNAKRQKDHEAYLKAEEAYAKRSKIDSEQSEIKRIKEAEREFRQFFQWRKNNKKPRG